MRYSKHIDYLVPSIIYLGTHAFYWARSPSKMASELSLDEQMLRRVFEGFPAIFRRSHRATLEGEHFYALQARYAQREGGDTHEPETLSYIAPVSMENLQLLTGFVAQMAEAERSNRRAWITSGIAMTAAIIAAAAAIAAAILKH